jgi:hypothetical protein
MPKVLVIAYLFPPVGGGGVQRPTKFVRYLPNFGWEPIVLSVKKPAYATYDASLLDELPDNLVIKRAKAFDPTALYFKLKRSGKITDSVGNSSSTVAGHQLLKSTLKRTLNPIRLVGRWIVERIFVPDDKIGWVPFALKAARKLINTHQPDVIYTTSAPFSAHIVGARLSKTTGIPWIADFRDPFVTSVVSGPQTPFHHWVRRKLEKNWVHHAARILTTAEHTTEDFCQRYPDYPTSKWVTITNGYDEDDFKEIQVTLPEVFTLRYVGSLYYKGYSSPDSLLYAIKLFLEDNPQARDQTRVVFTGRLDRTYAGYLENGIRRYELDGVVHVEEPVSHHEAVTRMCTASALLLILATTPGRELTLPGKVFEYLRSGRPILAPLAKGQTWELLEGRDNVFLAQTDDSESIARHLKVLFGRWQQGKLPDQQQSDIETFERQSLTAQLAIILQELIEKTNDKSPTAGG